MSILSWISDLFTPAANLIDDLHTSDEEKMKLQNELARIQENANSKILAYESKLVDARMKVQVAEAGSSHTITAIWRPLSSLLFVIVITLASFGLIPTPDVNFYDLAKILLGGYVGGRSLEKVASVLKLGSK